MTISNRYNQELKELEETFQLAINADISKIKAAIASASESSIVGVGSGGSYTVASVLASLHEKYTGRVSRPSTPLELICNPNLASSSPVFLISAEGKNPDIIEALTRARLYSSRTVHVLTNKTTSPLEEQISGLSNVNNHIFHLEKKDGYLATNSMLMDAILVARSYLELNNEGEEIPESIKLLTLKYESIEEWLDKAEKFISEIPAKKGIIIVYSPQLQAIATDLESKLSEAALSFCQVVDMRSFAHGRHLWCSLRPEDFCIFSITEPTLDGLWSHTLELLPKSIPTLTMKLKSSGPWDLISGLIAEMHFVARLSALSNQDVGRPNVPDYGKKIYYTKLDELIPGPQEGVKDGIRSQLEVIGTKWPSKPSNGVVARARKSYIDIIEGQTFQAAIFDYDGTLCNSQRKDCPPSPDIVGKLLELVENNILVAIASGRGRSINGLMKSVIPPEYWSKIILGLYNGGFIGPLGSDVEDPIGSCEFLNHAIRLVRRLESLGVPIEKIRPTYPYQISIRFREGISTEYMWLVIGDSMRQAGLDLSRMVCSKHSIDILGDGIGKDKVLAHIIRTEKIHPYKIITFGDQGAWPGNDTSLLEHTYSLSVDVPSRRLDRGWNLSPSHKRDVDATAWYLDNSSITEEKELKFKFPL